MTSSEPALVTEARLQAVLAELKQREPIFHTPQFGSTRADYEALLDPGYYEIGASGRRYSRQFVLDLVSTRAPHPDELSWVTEDFYCREIAADNYLLTYTLRQGARVSRRATLWRRTVARWMILYHQGTLLEAV
jgi:hypothetical protein